MPSDNELLRHEMQELRETMRELRADLKLMLEVKAEVKFHRETLERHDTDIRELFSKVNANALDNAGAKPKLTIFERFFWLCISGLLGLLLFFLEGAEK